MPPTIIPIFASIAASVVASVVVVTATSAVAIICIRTTLQYLYRVDPLWGLSLYQIIFQ
jgi:hypothetical protein